MFPEIPRKQMIVSPMRLAVGTRDGFKIWRDTGWKYLGGGNIICIFNGAMGMKQLRSSVNALYSFAYMLALRSVHQLKRQETLYRTAQISFPVTLSFPHTSLFDNFFFFSVQKIHINVSNFKTFIMMNFLKRCYMYVDFRQR